MRILMVSDFYPPVIGGLERYVQILSRELARRGHSVGVATLALEGAPAFAIEDGVRLYRVRGWSSRLLKPFYSSAERRFHPTVPDPGVMAALRRVIAQENPEIINVHSWILYSCLPVKACSRARVVMTLHDYGLSCPTKTYLHNNDALCDGPALAKCMACATKSYGPAKALALTTGLCASARFLHQRVDRYIAVSAAVKAASVPATGKPPETIAVVPTFAPDDVLEEVTQGARPDFLPPDDNYILFVGTLSEHKGIGVLLNAYHGLSDLASLVMIGAQYGDARAFPDGVTIVRNVPHAQVMAAWAHSAVGVVPSIWPEPQALVAFEAMACGRPVVASAAGGLPEAVIDGETGILVPPGDVSALREALCTLLRDPTLRRRMGDAAGRRARLFTASVMATRIEQVYMDVQARNNGGAHRDAVELPEA